MVDENPKIVFDLTKNEKQQAFFFEVVSAVNGDSEKRFFAYGGAVRGGKTFLILFILIMLCRKFPKSRWHVIRKDTPLLKSTTLPSFDKLMPRDWTFHREPGNYHATAPNGSIIFFKPENSSHDPELKDFLGLETNGIFIEQAEESSEQLWQKAIERAGSWYIDPMPPALTFLSFNPNFGWSNDIFYEPYLQGTLPPSHHYQHALPKDNPFVTTEQWAAWGQMDSRMYAAMILGDRDALLSAEGRAFWSFEKIKHTGDVPFIPEIPVAHLTFDFNVVPHMTLLCAQCQYKDDGTLQVRVFKEICLKHPRSTTQASCEDFILQFGGKVSSVYLYGDASGTKRDTRAARSDYDIALSVLRKWCSNKSLRVQRSNPEVRKRVLFLCAMFEGKIPGIEVVIDRGCTILINDLLYVKTGVNGGKLKTRIMKDGVSFEPLCHATDALEGLLTVLAKHQFSNFEKLLG